MSAAPLCRVIAVRLVTRAPAALTRFYAAALGATPAPAERLGGVDRELLGDGARTRLAIGAQRIDLDALATPGAPYPADVAADDPRFQHCAFVVADIAAVFAQVLACGATPISRDGPVQLPASAGGVVAAKLRDPEGHPFELLHFPPGAQPHWDATAAGPRGVLGLDHSAITVADATASTAFYSSHGLRARGAGVNRGASQAALDGIDAPVVDVVPLHPAGAGPHLELLGYRPAHRSPPLPALHDVAATRIAWGSDRAALLVDPDGHRHQLEAD